ncbi:hypothetical protein FHS43_006131 [Streptosporangium becharense]|uniref:DUF4231 domain-containing protein n=1 Tax=Streptosporangium becharense TaxID=1816182 RepID=A0A7W9IH83_9ACTN|nr:DUF4231 domain-containing protein [Streptosporangium becharense]MBB2914819.1 hypothetical protein [Streptosporangium becharense]MBB5820370.1 hypothetical protein [Streptosporangium becharense]
MSEIANIGAGPQAQLLAHNAKILALQEAIRVRKIQKRSLFFSAAIVSVGSVAIFIATVSTWDIFDMGPINRVAIPLTVLSGALFLRLAYLESERTGNESKTVRRLQLDLELAEEARRLSASHLGLPVYQRQYAYKEDIPRELTQLRDEAKYYRRIHNIFQAIIIVGSLGTTTAASLADTPAPYKWITVALSFAVGVSAGFTGYFKYRERSFYLQQTADAIEQNMAAFELGIPPYEDPNESKNLYKLSKEIELLRVEQRKRQQQLDQPHEGKEGTV